MKDRRKAGIEEERKEEERKEEERKEERGSGGYLFTPSVFTCPPSYRNKSRQKERHERMKEGRTEGSKDKKGGGRKKGKKKVVREERRKRKWWVPIHTIGIYMPSILPQQIKKDIKSGKTRKNEGRKEGSKDKKGGGRKKGKKKEGVVGTISHHRYLHALHPTATKQERYKIRKDTKEGRKEGRK